MYPRGRCHISHPKKMIFIPTYKVASNALVNNLSLRNHMDFQWQYADEYTVWAGTRHPVDRFVSAAAMFISTPSIHMNGTKADPSRPEVRAVYGLSTTGEKALRFLEMCEETYPGAFDTHFRSQISCLYQEDGRVLPLDFIVPLDKISGWVEGKWGVNIPKEFSSDQTTKDEIWSVITPDVFDRIEALYKTDLLLYQDAQVSLIPNRLNEYVQLEETRRQNESA